jgi:hypothetical protein
MMTATPTRQTTAPTRSTNSRIERNIIAPAEKLLSEYEVASGCRCLPTGNRSKSWVHNREGQIMPRGRGIYVDEPSAAGAHPPDEGELDSTNENEKRDPENRDPEKENPAPDEQALEHAQEPPD